MAKLTPTLEKFVLHWGEMGTRWGINRTVAQIHALLFISPNPLNAEEIAETLSIARSNVSTSLRELQNWGLVRITHVLGDRRDHFETLKDVWEMFRIIVEERKHREIDPTIEFLEESVQQAEHGGPEERQQAKSLQELLDFFRAMDRLYRSLDTIPSGSLPKIARLGAKLRKLVSTREE